MGPLPKGPRTAHINESHGADTNIMKFYITSNSTTYGKHWDKFKPRSGRHSGTGYLSNFRPGVYYSTSLDKLDNPVMGQICGQNYMTVTQKDFQPYRENTGVEPFPYTCHQVGSGFVRQKPVTIPTAHEVNSVFIDKRAATAPADILPKAKPLLHTLKPKDPVELENAGYFRETDAGWRKGKKLWAIKMRKGSANCNSFTIAHAYGLAQTIPQDPPIIKGPNYMGTESQQRFKGVPSAGKDLSTKIVGPKEESGFTHAHNVEPITFISGSPHKNDIPGWATGRPTGTSIMKTSFLPSKYPGGAEPLPNMAVGQERDTGFTREKAKPLYLFRNMSDAYDKASDIPGLRLDRTKKADPTDYLNMQNPNNYSSIHMNTYKGLQKPAGSEADRLGRTKIGTHELSGFSEGGERPVAIQSADYPNRFVTHYMTRFVDPTERGQAREGHCRGGLQTQKPDGFTKSTAVHSFGNEMNPSATLRTLDPYVSRSVRARDVFFDDHTHDSKLHSVQMQA